MGNRIDDGHSTTVEFSAIPGIKVWEKEVTPPGVDGGGPNDTTTMRNSVWRTMSPKKLKTLTEMTFTAAYAASVYPQLVASVNINQRITVTFADGSTLEFYGWLNSATPGAAVEGEQPTMDISVHPSNQDDDGNEVDPIFVDAGGTTGA